uniref:AlNc14C189G8413 protein n=1 Tax=Albugo laibachii Nc14 TaxID=890382 RepID=F0WPS1_9STRA|nr:AlNc14C189G8413 [Albugo laibachii Nc14]CCA24342.1 AlNc14C235G9360 [Albugo laibachii Nc14]|eukprot:CCA24342.1 AlNc14C235G9360 [Albugo laibachii Nc14]
MRFEWMRWCEGRSVSDNLNRVRSFYMRLKCFGAIWLEETVFSSWSGLKSIDAMSVREMSFFMSFDSLIRSGWFLILSTHYLAGVVCLRIIMDLPLSPKRSSLGSLAPASVSSIRRQSQGYTTSATSTTAACNISEISYNLGSSAQRARDRLALFQQTST